MEKKEEIQLKCPKVGCDGKEFRLETTKAENFTVVNEKADVLYGTSIYTYRCLKCQKVFSSKIAPRNKKLILG